MKLNLSSKEYLYGTLRILFLLLAPISIILFYVNNTFIEIIFSLENISTLITGLIILIFPWIQVILLIKLDYKYFFKLTKKLQNKPEEFRESQYRTLFKFYFYTYFIGSSLQYGIYFIFDYVCTWDFHLINLYKFYSILIIFLVYNLIISQLPICLILNIIYIFKNLINIKFKEKLDILLRFFVFINTIYTTPIFWVMERYPPSNLEFNLNSIIDFLFSSYMVPFYLAILFYLTIIVFFYTLYFHHVFKKNE